MNLNTLQAFTQLWMALIICTRLSSSLVSTTINLVHHQWYQPSTFRLSRILPLFLVSWYWSWSFFFRVLEGSPLRSFSKHSNWESIRLWQYLNWTRQRLINTEHLHRCRAGKVMCYDEREYEWLKAFLKVVMWMEENLEAPISKDKQEAWAGKNGRQSFYN